MSTASHYPLSRIIARTAVPLIIIGGAVVLLTWTGFRACEHIPEVMVSPVTEIVSDAAPKRATEGLQAPGWLEPMPFATEVAALREGIVETVHVLEGERVIKGALMVTLEQRGQEIALARSEAELLSAHAEVGAREAALVAATRTLEFALDATTTLATASSSVAEADGMLLKLGAEIAEAQATYDEAADELARKNTLVSVGGASEGEVRRLALRTAALEAKAQSLRLERPVREARLTALQVILASATTARELLISEHLARDSAQAALASAIGARSAREAMRDEAQLMLERSELRAPCDGVVLSRLVRPGSRVGGDAMSAITIYDPAQLQVRCDVPLKDAAKLSVGLTAQIRVDALPDRVFTGAIIRIVPQGDLQKNTLQCKVSVIDPDGALRPDMLARVRIETVAIGSTSARGEVIAVPADALRSRDDANHTAQVLLVIPEAHSALTQLRTVQLGGERRNGWIEVTQGLASGDRVVLDSTVAAGTRITPIETLKGDAP